MRKKYKTGTICITVDYGYDIHNIIFSGRTYNHILAGKTLTINGQGFPVDGFTEQDIWIFNEEHPGSLSIITVEHRDVFSGDISDAEVEIEAL